MKDNFSSQSDQYALYRPTYPASVYPFLLSLVKCNICAWDVGTGNGQVAVELAPFFEKIIASDISSAQLQVAPSVSNVEYIVCRAESTPFQSNSFDLITVAQAIHWFNFDQFYNEVKRVAKPDALLVVMGYGNIKVSPAVDEVINHLYKNITAPYWDNERTYLDENYTTIPFPFNEIIPPPFSMDLKWSIDSLKGYLNTWSGLKHCVRITGRDPISEINDDLLKAWGDDAEKTVSFPFLLRIAKINK